MRTINVDEAQTDLSRLVEEAAKGEPFIIAKAGKPLVKVVAVDAPASHEARRLGFLQDIKVPDDFDHMGEAEIGALFGATE